MRLDYSIVAVHAIDTVSKEWSHFSLLLKTEEHISGVRINGSTIRWLLAAELLCVGGEDILPITTLDLTANTTLRRSDDDGIPCTRQNYVLKVYIFEGSKTFDRD